MLSHQQQHRLQHDVAKPEKPPVRKPFPSKEEQKEPKSSQPNQERPDAQIAALPEVPAPVPRLRQIEQLLNARAAVATNGEVPSQSTTAEQLLFPPAPVQLNPYIPATHPSENAAAAAQVAAQVAAVAAHAAATVPSAPISTISLSSMSTYPFSSHSSPGAVGATSLSDTRSRNGIPVSFSAPVSGAASPIPQQIASSSSLSMSQSHQEAFAMIHGKAFQPYNTPQTYVHQINPSAQQQLAVCASLSGSPIHTNTNPSNLPFLPQIRTTPIPDQANLPYYVYNDTQPLFDPSLSGNTVMSSGGINGTAQIASVLGKRPAPSVHRRQKKPPVVDTVNPYVNAPEEQAAAAAAAANINNNSNIQPGTIISATASFVDVSDPQNLLDPSLPRKKRNQVKNACINCRKACKKCSHSRPCERCISHGIQDSCIDVARKDRSSKINRRQPPHPPSGPGSGPSQMYPPGAGFGGPYGGLNLYGSIAMGPAFGGVMGMGGGIYNFASMPTLPEVTMPSVPQERSSPSVEIVTRSRVSSSASELSNIMDDVVSNSSDRADVHMPAVTTAETTSLMHASKPVVENASAAEVSKEHPAATESANHAQNNVAECNPSTSDIKNESGTLEMLPSMRRIARLPADVAAARRRGHSIQSSSRLPTIVDVLESQVAEDAMRHEQNPYSNGGNQQFGFVAPNQNMMHSNRLIRHGRHASFDVVNVSERLSQTIGARSISGARSRPTSPVTVGSSLAAHPRTTTILTPPTSASGHSRNSSLDLPPSTLMSLPPNTKIHGYRSGVSLPFSRPLYNPTKIVGNCSSSMHGHHYPISMQTSSCSHDIVLPRMIAHEDPHHHKTSPRIKLPNINRCSTRLTVSTSTLLPHHRTMSTDQSGSILTLSPVDPHAH